MRPPHKNRMHCSRRGPLNSALGQIRLRAFGERTTANGSRLLGRQRMSAQFPDGTRRSAKHVPTMRSGPALAILASDRLVIRPGRGAELHVRRRLAHARIESHMPGS